MPQLISKSATVKYLSFIDPERGRFGEIYPEVMMFSEGFSPREVLSLNEIFRRNSERKVYKWYIIPKN